MALDRRRPIDQALPVRARQVLQRVEGDALIVQRVAHVEQGELISREHGDVFADRLPTRIAGVREADLARLAALGRHQDDAVGAAGAIDGGSRGILQDVDGLDVAWSELVEGLVQGVSGYDDPIHH